MKLSHIALSAALVLGSTCALAATGPLDLSTGSAGLQNTPVIGSFSDVFTFTLVSASTANSSITTVVNVAQNIDFTSITLTGPTNASFTKLLGDPVEVWSLATTVLSAGSYTLTLAGLNSAAGASYGGNFAVTPVPEPETMALMLAGLGAVGFVARRRKA